MNKLGTDDHRILLDMLKEARINAGFRQVDLASALNVPQSLISKYEAGERRIDVLELMDICNVLGLTLPDFVRELEERIKRKAHEAE